MKRVVTRLASAGLAAALVAGCASRQLARTVGTGRTEFGVLVGGPLQSSLGGFPAPVPEHRVHARVGLTDDLDLSGSVPLAPLASAVLALDAGLVAQLVREPSFAMAISARLHVVLDLDDGWGDDLFPELGLHAEQRLDPRFALIFGASALAQASQPAERPRAFLAPYLGGEVLLGEHALSLALGWINPWETALTSVRWQPEGAGAITVTFGWRIQPGGVR